MNIKRLFGSAAALLLLTACSPTATLPPAAETVAIQAPDAFQHVTFQAGNRFDSITDAGVYFLDTATGEGEGWIPPDDGPLTVTDGNRFIVAKSGYLVERETETVWRWDPDRFRLLLPSAWGFLFATL